MSAAGGAIDDDLHSGFERGGRYHQLVASSGELVAHVAGDLGLGENAVGQELGVDARRRDGGLGVHAKVDQVDEGLYDTGDNRGST